MARSADERAGLPASASSAAAWNLRRWLLAVGLVALAALAVSLLFGWRRLQVRLERREGLQLARQERFAEAEPLLQRALERQPDDLTVVKALALGQLDARKLSEAEISLGRWCALRPNEAEPFRWRMNLQLQLKRLPLALADGQRALELEPDQDALRRQVAQWLLSTGRLTEAERECRRCLERQPNDRELLYLLAEIEQGQGRQTEAASILDSLLRNDPSYTAAQLARGILYWNTNQPEQAIPLLRQVLAQDPARQQSARYHLSLALEQVGQTEEAQRLMAEFQWHDAMAELQWRQAQDLRSQNGQPTNPGMQVRIAEGLLRVGKADEAVRLLERILEQDPRLTAAHELLAAHYEKQGQTDKAAEHRRRAEK